MKPFFNPGDLMDSSCVQPASKVKKVELTTEDTECAQALLDLARSFSVNREPPRNEKENVERTHRNVIPPLTSKKKITVKKTVLSKTSANSRGPKGHPLHQTPVNTKNAFEPTPFVQELNKRINLDHPYCLPPWASEYPKPVNPAFYSLLDEVEGAGSSAVTAKESPKKWGKVSLPPGVRTFHPNLSGKYDSKQRSNDANAISNKAGKSDLYQPDNNNYKNFNLLLKCLTTDENREDMVGSRKRCYSTMVESKPVESSSTNSLEVGFAQEAKCTFCKKVFSSPTYLRKHRQRMHPTEFSEQGLETNSILCPSCNVLMEKANFDQHVCKHDKTKEQSPLEKSVDVFDGSENLIIDESPGFSTCQFCGMRLRKALLDRHINSEHSLESGISSGETQQDNISESGSETLSGSDQDTGEDIISCDICFAYVQKSFLGQHVREKHYNLVSGTGYVNLSKLHTAEQNSHTQPFHLNQYSRVSGTPKSGNAFELESTTHASPPIGSEPVGQYMLQRFLSENHEANRSVFDEKHLSVMEQQNSQMHQDEQQN